LLQKVSFEPACLHTRYSVRRTYIMLAYVHRVWTNSITLLTLNLNLGLLTSYSTYLDCCGYF